MILYIKVKKKKKKNKKKKKKKKKKKLNTFYWFKRYIKIQNILYTTYYNWDILNIYMYKIYI